MHLGIVTGLFQRVKRVKQNLDYLNSLGERQGLEALIVRLNSVDRVG